MYSVTDDALLQQIKRELIAFDAFVRAFGSVTAASQTVLEHSRYQDLQRTVSVRMTQGDRGSWSRLDGCSATVMVSVLSGFLSPTRLILKGTIRQIYATPLEEVLPHFSSTPSTSDQVFYRTIYPIVKLLMGVSDLLNALGDRGLFHGVRLNWLTKFHCFRIYDFLFVLKDVKEANILCHLPDDVPAQQITFNNVNSVRVVFCDIAEGGLIESAPTRPTGTVPYMSQDSCRAHIGRAFDNRVNVRRILRSRQCLADEDFNQGRLSSHLRESSELSSMRFLSTVSAALTIPVAFRSSLWVVRYVEFWCPAVSPVH